MRRAYCDDLLSVSTLALRVKHPMLCTPMHPWISGPIVQVDPLHLYAGNPAYTKQPSPIASWYNLAASAAVPELTVSLLGAAERQYH